VLSFLSIAYPFVLIRSLISETQSAGLLLLLEPRRAVGWMSARFRRFGEIVVMCGFLNDDLPPRTCIVAPPPLDPLLPFPLQLLLLHLVPIAGTFSPQTVPALVPQLLCLSIFSPMP